MGHHDGHDVITHLKAGRHAGADLVEDPRGVHARDVRRRYVLEQGCPAAAAQPGVGRIDSGRADPDAQFPRPGVGIGQVHQVQDAGVTEPCYSDSSHAYGQPSRAAGIPKVAHRPTPGA